MSLKEDIDKLKSLIPLQDAMQLVGMELIGESDSSAKARCFLHQDDTPSVSISKVKGLYHCFSTGCQASGDVITFYRHWHKLTTQEAVAKLAEDFGIEVGVPTDERSKKLRRMIDLMRAFSSKLHKQLLTGQLAAKARTYLEKRRVPKEAWITYGLGFSPSETFAQAALRSCGATADEARQLEAGRTSLYAGRVVFPLVEPFGGRIVHYSGQTSRAVDGPKYVGPSKSHPLTWPGQMFGLDICRKNAKGGSDVILVEGFFDVLVLGSHGFPQTVAINGSTVNDQQLHLLDSLGISKIVSLLDHDAAGIEGAKKLVLSGASRLNLRIGRLPEGDPDEFLIKNGGKSLRRVFESAIGCAEFLVGLEADGLTGDADSRVRAVASLVELSVGLSKHELAILKSRICEILRMRRDDLEDLIIQDSEEKLLESERMVLAFCVKDPEKLTEAHAIIGQRMVWRLSKHAIIWDALLKLRRQKADSFTAELIRDSAPKEVVLNGSLDSIIEIDPSNFDLHLGRLRDQFVRRTIRDSSKSLASSIVDSKTPVDEAVSRHLSALSTSLISGQKIEFTASEQVESAMEYVHTRMESGGKIPGIDIGEEWKSLMQISMGFQPSYMYLLSALPKVGKTNTVLNWCLSAAVEKKVPSLWLNLEMSERDLALRSLSILSGVSNGRLRTGAIEKKEKELVDEAAQKYYEAPLYVVNANGLSVHEIASLARKYVHSKGVQICFIDYIQLIKMPGKAAYWEKHQEISTEIKSLTNSLNVPVVAISQLSKSAIEGGGSLHVGGTFKYLQDCDLAMELRRKTIDEMKEDPMGNLKLTVEYNRHGLQDAFIGVLFNQETLKCQEA